MRTPFQVTFSTPSESIWEEASKTLAGSKEMHEVRDVFSFLTIWREYLNSVFGELHSLTHLSNPDDPPDVIAHFHNGDLNIEITSLEPNHIHQSERLERQHLDKCRTSIPISYRPHNGAEALEIMLNPGHPLGWEGVSERCAVRNETLVSRALSKLENPAVQALNPGVILLTGNLMGDPHEEQALLTAFQEVAALPSAVGWQFGTVYQWNCSSFYSTVYSAQSGLQVKK